MGLEHNKLWYRSELNKYFQKGDRVLDFGCGDGYSILIGNEFGIEIWGLEISPESLPELSKSEKSGGRNMPLEGNDLPEGSRDFQEWRYSEHTKTLPRHLLKRFKWYDGEKFPFPDNFFDALFARSSINKDWTESSRKLKKKAMREAEIDRVLKKGAKKIII